MVNNRLATGTEKVVVVGVVSTSIQLMEIIKILKYFYSDTLQHWSKPACTTVPLNNSLQLLQDTHIKKAGKSLSVVGSEVHK